MSKHATELVFTTIDHTHGNLVDPRNPARYITFNVSRMLDRVTFRGTGHEINMLNVNTYLGAARRLLGSTAGYEINFYHDSVMLPVYAITIKRGAK